MSSQKINDEMKNAFRKNRCDSDLSTADSLVLDEDGTVMEGSIAPVACDSPTAKLRFKERVRRTNGKQLPTAPKVLTLCEGGVVREEKKADIVCASSDGTIHWAEISPAPQESPTAAKKKAVHRARVGEAVSKEWLFVCDPHGKVFESFQSKTSTVAEPQVAVASMDGTIYDAKITPVSPVHCVANNKKQKALYRASPKLGPLAGPPPVYIADAGGEIQIPERWDFFIPEVGLSC
jgi:hypothetical protein